MDSIQLSGIRCYGYTGVLPEEQVLGQWFEVELTLWLELTAAGQSDRLTETLDYRTVIATVQTLVKTAKFSLLERLATAIAEAVLHPESSSQTVPIQQVRVRLQKQAAPIPDFGGTITIDLTRSGREEGRGKRKEGRGKREEGRGKREEGRGKREEENLKLTADG